MTHLNFSQSYEDFIVRAVHQQGEIISLSAFCNEHGMDYSYTHHLVRRLKLLGILNVERLSGHGHPLAIRIGSVPYVP